VTHFLSNNLLLERRERLNNTFFPQASAGNTLALQVDSDGKVRYDAIGTLLSPYHDSPKQSLTRATTSVRKQPNKVTVKELPSNPLSKTSFPSLTVPTFPPNPSS
jgi:hypothetical protein